MEEKQDRDNRSDGMSEALDKIKSYRKQTLVDLYNQCTVGQQGLFNRMYGSTDKIPDEKVDWAIQQCEKTIKKNKTKVVK